MKIYLIRHGQAFSPDKDPAQNLSPEGEEQARTIGGFLKARSITLDYLYHSSKKRASQTANIISEYISVENIIEVGHLMPDSDVNPMIAELYNLEGSLMIAGHLPYLPKLASKLIFDSTNYYMANFPPCGVMCLENIDHKKWCLNWFVNPEIV